MQGKSLEEKLVLSWQELQADVDHLMDSGMNSSQRLHKRFPGIKQVAFVCMHMHKHTHTHTHTNIYIYIYIKLTPWGRVFKKLIIPQIVKKFPAFYETESS